MDFWGYWRSDPYGLGRGVALGLSVVAAVGLAKYFGVF